MSSYYENEKEMQRRNIDSDLASCLTYNPQPYELMGIERVLAVVEGDRDGPPWHWIIKLSDKRYVYTSGSCDYTGWDCQSSASSAFLKAPKDALAIIDDYNDERKAQTIESLREQLKKGKKQTWHERMDKVMPTEPAEVPHL